MRINGRTVHPIKGSDLRSKEKPIYDSVPKGMHRRSIFEEFNVVYIYYIGIDKENISI